MKYKMLKTIGSYTAGSEYEIDTDTAALYVEKGYAEAVANDEDALVAEIKTLVADEVKTQVKAEIANELKGRKRLPAVAADPHETWHFGEYVAAICGYSNPNLSHLKEKSFNLLTNKYGEIAGKGMSQGTTTAGGFTVPELWGTEVLKLEGLDSVLFPNRAAMYPIEGGKKLFLSVLDQTGSPSGGSQAFNSTVTSEDVSESTAPVAPTALAYKQLEITYTKKAAYVPISSELLENSFALIQQMVTEALRDEIISKIDYECFHGGNGFTGLVGHPSTLKVNRKTANVLTFQDIARMMKRIHPKYYSQYIWIAHPYLMEEFMELADADGRLIWLNNAVDGPGARLAGLPLIFSDVASTVGSEADLVLLNPKSYAIGVNREPRIAVSTDVRFYEDDTVIKVTALAGGKPKFTAPFKLRDASSTVSGCVVLDDLASG